MPPIALVLCNGLLHTARRLRGACPSLRLCGRGGLTEDFLACGFGLRLDGCSHNRPCLLRPFGEGFPCKLSSGWAQPAYGTPPRISIGGLYRYVYCHLYDNSFDFNSINLCGYSITRFVDYFHTP